MKKSLILLLFALLISCSTISLPKNIYYTLINDEFEKANITIMFGDNTLYGYSGVNNYHSPYSVKGENISVEYTATTLMAGETRLMNLEYKYLELLNNVKKIQLEKDMLILTTKDGYKLKFKK